MQIIRAFPTCIKYALNIGYGITEKEKLIKLKLKEKEKSFHFADFLKNLLNMLTKDVPPSLII